MARSGNKALAYFRRSTTKQELSLGQQLDWANRKAKAEKVSLDATPEDLAIMQSRNLHTYKSIRLDDGISGRDLTRPGFLSLLADVKTDRSITHLLIYKRDRLGRPDDAMAMAQIEKKILQAGVTILMEHHTEPPMVPGKEDLSRDLSIYLGYYESGDFLRKHAERMIECHRKLADMGFRTGGNPPYAFARALVDNTGNVLEILPAGKTVQQTGCHVRLVVQDMMKLAIWLEILQKKDVGWGFKRIANWLNDRGIPSPDSGRTRKDNGVQHYVSGRWNPNTVSALCRNRAIIGMSEYGTHSEGKIRRLGSDGPRLLEETDRPIGSDDEVKIITNDPSIRIIRESGKSHFDREAWDRIQADIARRGEVQRGIPRAKDPGRYPLACRIIDMTNDCGWPMYARTTQGRAIYTCGRYMKDNGCASNNVDAEAILNFTLKTIRQFVDQGNHRDRLREKLLARVHQHQNTPMTDPIADEMRRLESLLTDKLRELEVIEFRMARTLDDSVCEAITRQFKAAKVEIASLKTELEQLQAKPKKSLGQTAEEQVDSAMRFLDDLERITANPELRAELPPFLARLGVMIGLSFRSMIKGKKRVVQRLVSGVIAFNNAPLPVPMYGRDHVPCEHAGKNDLESCESNYDMGADKIQLPDEGMEPSPGSRGGHENDVCRTECRSESISTTKVNRAKRI